MAALGHFHSHNRCHVSEAEALIMGSSSTQCLLSRLGKGALSHFYAHNRCHNNEAGPEALGRSHTAGLLGAASS